jgi:hypothetical protein
MNERAQPRKRLGWLPALCAAALALAQLPGCGGSGGVDSGGTGMDTPTLAIGPISGLGSIVVNGVHYDETQAQVVDADGQALTASALTLGSVTRIDASPPVNTGTRLEAVARAIQVTEALVGPVEAVNATAGTARVLGQTVSTTAGTVFEASLGSGLASLRVGAVVAVFGQVDRVGARIVATRIEPRSGVSHYTVTGSVLSLDRAASRLGLGLLTIGLAEAGSLPSTLDIGAVVRVKLRTTATGGVWAATALRLNDPPLPDRDNIEIEGRVTAFATAQRFSVDGIVVDATSATFGSGTVALGKRVEVDGRSVAGTIIARKVSVDDEDGGSDSSIELEGRITSLDVAAQTFVVRGTTVRYDANTRFISSTAADLALNRKLSVKGRPAADRSLVQATSIHIEL